MERSLFVEENRAKEKKWHETILQFMSRHIGNKAIASCHRHDLTRAFEEDLENHKDERISSLLVEFRKRSVYIV